jgi:hypothetical protein
MTYYIGKPNRDAISKWQAKLATCMPHPHILSFGNEDAE